MENYRHISHQALHDFVVSVFLRKKFSEEHAKLAAEVLLKADLRGIDSHGVARLSGYVRLMEKERINPSPKFKITAETPTTATLDADSAVGLVSAPYAMQLAIEKAKSYGSGWVAVANSNHFGIAGYHAAMALEHDMIGFAMTNASPLVTPALGKERMLGTNPIAVAIPAGKEKPFILDMATSSASNGKLEIAQRKGKAVPEGWLLDENGQTTTDANALKNKGFLLNLGSDMEHGSYKGYGLGSWVDIFSGVLGGANFGPWVPPFVAFLDPVQNQPGKGIGHFVGAWRVDGFSPVEEFKNRMDLWISRFKQTRPLNENEPVKIPGEPEYESELQRKQNGIPLITAVVKDLSELAAHLDISLPSALQ